MTFIAVQCPHCHSEQIVKRGKTRWGTQRYLCQNMACAKGSFLLDYRNRGCLPEVKHTIIDMSLNVDAAKLIFFLQGYERRISNVYGFDRSAVSSGVLYASRPGCVPTSSRQRRNPASQACASIPLDWPVGS